MTQLSNPHKHLLPLPVIKFISVVHNFRDTQKCSHVTQTVVNVGLAQARPKYLISNTNEGGNFIFNMEFSEAKEYVQEQLKLMGLDRISQQELERYTLGE